LIAYFVVVLLLRPEVEILEFVTPDFLVDIDQLVFVKAAFK